MNLLLTNISQLLQTETPGQPITVVKGAAMNQLPMLEQAYVYIIDKRIAAYGPMSQMPQLQAHQTIDCTGRVVSPCWVDSHTHLVFAATREAEFVDRINGLSYEEIAKRGGGILNSAAKLQAMSEQQLFDQSLQRLHQIIATGTGAVEIKSGYGLTLEAELKMLRVIRRLKEQNLIPIKASFLAAHAYPLEFKQNHSGYIDSIINQMLPRVAAEGLADYMDVFCEQGFFSVAETDQLLTAAAKYNLPPKIHANQLHYSGGVQVGVKHKAISVDHLECVGPDEIAALQNSTTMPTLLPSAAFFLGLPYQPARKIIDAGLPVALATDYNPGSSPGGSMPFVMSLACTQMHMTPAEAITACTANAACALQLENELGSIAIGKRASLIITQPISSYAVIPYSFSSSVIDRVLY